MNAKHMFRTDKIYYCVLFHNKQNCITKYMTVSRCWAAWFEALLPEQALFWLREGCAQDQPCTHIRGPKANSHRVPRVGLSPKEAHVRPLSRCMHVPSAIAIYSNTYSLPSEFTYPVSIYGGPTVCQALFWWYRCGHNRKKSLSPRNLCSRGGKEKTSEMQACVCVWRKVKRGHHWGGMIVLVYNVIQEILLKKAAYELRLERGKGMRLF